tara:strand:+ start:879 stop:1142 length:264 start_codon:yes stop_codon:yes gene_type:complete
MKSFFYKSILVFFLFLAAFHFSFGYVVKKIKIELEYNLSKEKLEELKIKIKEEMRSAINKENYIKPEDAIIINKFLEKVRSDLEKNK